MSGQQTVVVIGQGYVGLPVAMRAVEMGYATIGVDLDKRRVAQLQSGHSYVEDISHDVLAAALASGSYRATDEYDFSDFDVAVITVPTPLKETLPDLGFIESAGRSIASRVKPGSVVVLESTTYPGTTEQLLVPILEEGSGLRAGEDFFVGYSPERIDPGNTTWGFVETPKVVSGINEASLAKVDAFYSSLIDTTVPVSGTKEAELTKLLENTFRHVNIALVNELAVFAHQLGVDVWESINAASTKPFGYMKFTPGPGVGGHCLPVDPSYLSWQVRRQLGQTFRFVELANDVNEHMPDYVVQRLISMLNEQGRAMRGTRVLVVGLAYKRDSSDIREAPALRLIQLLNEFGAEVLAVDPHISDAMWPAGAARTTLDASALDGVDMAVIVTNHSGVDLGVLQASGIPILDTTNALSGAATRL